VDLSDVSNVQLVRLCGREPDNGLAWDEFVNRFNQYIILSVIRVLSAKSARPPRLEKNEPPELVRDLVQDVYLGLLQNGGQALKRFQGRYENSIYVYLAKIVTTVVMDHLREQWADKRAAQAISLSELFAQENSPPDRAQPQLAVSGTTYTEYQFDEQVTIDDVTHRLDHLLEGEQKQRDILIFLLHVFDGLTTSDIACQKGLGLTQRGVASVLRRTKQKLREAIEAERKDSI